MAQRRHVPNFAKIRGALGPHRERWDVATVATVMERMIAAARVGLSVGPVEVVIVTNDTLLTRRMELKTRRFVETVDATFLMKPGLVHWDAPGDPVEVLTGLPSPPEHYPFNQSGRRSRCNQSPSERRRPRPSANLGIALLVAGAWHRHRASPGPTGAGFRIAAPASRTRPRRAHDVLRSICAVCAVCAVLVCRFRFDARSEAGCLARPHAVR